MSAGRHLVTGRTGGGEVARQWLLDGRRRERSKVRLYCRKLAAEVRAQIAKGGIPNELALLDGYLNACQDIAIRFGARRSPR